MSMPSTSETPSGTKFITDNILFAQAGYGILAHSDSSSSSQQGLHWRGMSVFNNGISLAMIRRPAICRWAASAVFGRAYRLKKQLHLQPNRLTRSIRTTAFVLAMRI